MPVTKADDDVTALLLDLWIPQHRDMTIIFRRLYPGPAARARGAWSWSASTYAGIELAGSQDPLREVLKAHKEERLSAKAPEQNQQWI